MRAATAGGAIAEAPATVSTSPSDADTTTRSDLRTTPPMMTSEQGAKGTMEWYSLRQRQIMHKSAKHVYSRCLIYRSMSGRSVAKPYLSEGGTWLGSVRGVIGPERRGAFDYALSPGNAKVFGAGRDHGRADAELR